MFKVNNKDTRATPIAGYTLQYFLIRVVAVVDNLKLKIN